MQAEGNAPKTSKLRSAAIPLACLIVGFTVTTLLYFGAVQSERTRDAADFSRHADKFRNDLAARIHAYIDTLPGLKALNDLEKNPNELRFTQFVSAISLQQRYPGLAFFFTADRVEGDDLDLYLASVRNDRSLRPGGRPDFNVMPPGARPEYLIIRHTFPDSANTVGYDLLDPSKSYRIDVERAISAGTAIATPPLLLARDRDGAFRPETTSVVVRLAVYKSSVMPSTAQQRREALHGIAGVALQTKILVESALTPEIRERLKIRILDGSDKHPNALVFDDTWLGSQSSNTLPHAHRVTLQVDVANRKWIIEAADRMAPISSWAAPVPLIVLTAGFVISILLSMLMRTLVSTTRKAQGAFAEAMEQLKREQRALEEAQALALIGSWEWDVHSNNVYWSAEMSRLYGMTAEEWLKDTKAIFAGIPADELSAAKSTLYFAVNEYKPFDIEHRIVTPDGETRFFHACARVQHDESGQVRALVGTVQDITARKRNDAAVAAHELRYRLLFENSLDGVMQTRPDGQVIAANPAACALFGRTESEMLTLTYLDLVDITDPRQAELISQRNIHGKAAGELRMKRANNELFDAELSSSVYIDPNGFLSGSMLVRDVTERKTSEREIARLAFNDGLTGLPNRRLLLNSASLAMEDAQRHRTLGALLFIDLDNFKTVNDAKGHATGDALLCQVAERLKALIREGDTVARLGGDEFVILFNGLADTAELASSEALAAAERIREALCAGYIIDGRQYLSTASIGISIFPASGQNRNDLLREADTAMYRAKAEGRNRIALFAPSMQTRVEEQLSLANALEHALRAGELQMVAQSQFDNAQNPCGAELLLRWTHPTDGPIPPAKFIPLAEETGLIIRIGDWVIEQGCKTVARLQAAGLSDTVSVNVSPRQFHQPEFIDFVSATLAVHQVRPGQLIFEVTEGLLIGNLEETAVRMRELNALGIRFSIDDFGTGYSSLVYLKKLPLYELKIDKTFVQDTPTDPNDTAIVQLILGMARHLHLRVVAEGVETQEQRAFLLQSGCDSLQGYLLARPVPLGDWLVNRTGGRDDRLAASAQAD